MAVSAGATKALESEHLHIRHNTNILYAGSNGDLCAIYATSEGSGESAQQPQQMCATISVLYQCFKTAQCVVQ